jgi:uncharacterized membrane protein
MDKITGLRSIQKTIFRIALAHPAFNTYFWAAAYHTIYTKRRKMRNLSSVNRLIKFFWLISLVIFFAALLLVYAFLPDRVAIHANTAGMPDEFIARESFFYFSLIGFVGANVLLYVLRKLLLLTRRTARTERELQLREDLAGWLLGLAGTINFFFVLVMFFFGVFNNAEGFSTWHFALLVYTGPLLLVLIFVLLAYIFIKRRA